MKTQKQLKRNIYLNGIGGIQDIVTVKTVGMFYEQTRNWLRLFSELFNLYFIPTLMIPDRIMQKIDNNICFYQSKQITKDSTEKLF